MSIDSIPFFYPANCSKSECYPQGLGQWSAGKDLFVVCPVPHSKGAREQVTRTPFSHKKVHRKATTFQIWGNEG